MKQRWKVIFRIALPAMLAVIFCVAALAAGAEEASDAEYAEAMNWCSEAGLMQGVSATDFDPEGTLTRAMVAAVLYRAAGEPAVSGSASFVDVRPDQWYSGAVLWARRQGIVQGYGNDLFGPETPITREQLDVILRRYQGESPQWTGDPALAATVTRAEAAMAFYAKLRPKEPEEPEKQEGRALVVYFSATNNTEGVARQIANLVNADVYEIIPEQPYTSADLNYGNSASRTSVEMNDPNSRPSISGSAENMEEYDVIFLGYPIWWGQAPKIVSTFLESYDFSGKTIIPFCTSGSSGIGSSAVNLHELADAATWLDGQRLSGGASESQVKTWLESLDLEFSTK